MIIIINRSILYSAYGDYQVKRSMKGAVACEHCSKGRTSRPFTGYNYGKWLKRVRGLEGLSLRWTSTAEEIADVAVALW
jgi:hypothetical protein